MGTGVDSYPMIGGQRSQGRSFFCWIPADLQRARDQEFRDFSQRRCYSRAMNRTDPTERNLPLALRRGFAGSCPACGQARLFGRFLKPVPACPACGQDWTVKTADDFPAYLVILLLGHLMVPAVIETNRHIALSAGFQMLFWPSLSALLALMLIQPMKGFVIGLLWAR